MSTTDDGLSRALTVAILVMVLASSPVTALGYGGQSSSSVATPEGDGEFTFAATDDYLGCVEFSDDANSVCLDAITDQLTVTSEVIPTAEAGKMKLEVNTSVVSGFSGDYTVEARADNGEWSQASLATAGDTTLLSVENSYRRGSIQYPTVYVRVIDDSTGDVVAFDSQISESPVTIPTGDESWYDDGREVDNTDTSNPTKGATVVGDDQREVRPPGYSTVSRFNDNDGSHETFEDKSLPPVRYDRAGAKIAGPEGNVLHFDNLREDSGWPAIFRHGNGRMNLGTALYGVESAEYQKMRIDYGLQTETSTQTVQVNLVNSYGEVIDPSVRNAESRRLSQTTGQSASYFNDRKQYENALYEDNLNTNSIEFALTSAEREYIAENNDIYVTYSTNNRAYLLLYRTPIISQSVQDKTNQNFVPDPKHFEENFDANPGEENTATFDAKYRIKGQLNDKYDSFDREPNENLEVQITVNNHGDERVERRVGIYSMSDNNVSLYGNNADEKTVDKRVVGVEPRSSKTFTVEFDYEEHEYGYHNVSVLDTTDPDNPTQIARGRDGKAISRVYVLQPATFEVKNVITPNSWLMHDNFNTTVVVQNVGDLNGTGVINGEFQDWTGAKAIPDTPGGNVRESAPGSYTNVTFDSQNHQYSPSYPESPANGNDENRPNSPFGTELTYSDNRPHHDDNVAVDNRSIFEATASHPFATPNERLYESINHTDESETVRIYNLEIVTVKVEDERSNDDTWYASGYSYTNNTSSPYWTAWKPATDYDIFENPYEKMPTIDDGKFIYPPYRVGAGWDSMDVTVEVRNNGQTPIGDARVQVRTSPDKIGLDGSKGGIIGTSGQANLDEFQSRELHVPVVIRNDETNGGTHTLSAEVRDRPDYIQRVDVRQNEDNAGTDQFETQVNIELWADFIHQRTTTPDATVNERCGGENPTDDGDDTVTCDADAQELLDIDQFHKNYGGADGTLTVDAFIEAWRDPSGGHSHYSDFGLLSNPLGSDNTNYWNPQSKTLAPNQEKRFDADDIPIDEPGIYAVKATPHRENAESGDLDQYNDTSYVPEQDYLLVKILDITTPEAHAFISDTTYPCKSGTCNGQDGTWAVHEGATVEFNNDSVDNVVVDWIQWEGSPSYNGGERRCHGADHCYSQAGYADNQNADRIVHRVGESDETITLRVRDHPAYGAGASVDGTGTPNEETEDFPLTVNPDQNDPDVSIVDDYHNNPDNSPDSSTVWESYSSTGYDGIEVCFTASASDAEIGIEADDWSGTSLSGGANDDTRCRTWSSLNDKTAIYQAWDFAGRTATDRATVTVEHDDSPPSTSLGARRSSKWVDKAHHSSSVTYSGTTSDGETGLINCGDSGNYPYSWSGDTNGDSNRCSDSFTTRYHSTSGSSETFSVTLQSEDYHGNTAEDDASVTLYEDSTPPHIHGETSDSGSGSGGTTVCVSPNYEDHGPTSSDGIGLHSTSGTVCESYNYEAPGNIAPDPSPACEETETTRASDTNTVTRTGTLYAEDRHGNRVTTSYSITITDRDYDSKTETGPDCPEPPEEEPPECGSMTGGGHCVSIKKPTLPAMRAGHVHAPY